MTTTDISTIDLATLGLRARFLTTTMRHRRTVRGYTAAEWERLATVSDAVGLRAYLRLAVVRNAIAMASGSLASIGCLIWWPGLLAHGPTPTAFLILTGIIMVAAGATAAVVHPFALALALRAVDPARLTVQSGDRELRDKFTRTQIKAGLVAATTCPVVVLATAYLLPWLKSSPLYMEWQWLVWPFSALVWGWVIINLVRSPRPVKPPQP
jgi:hypothetical protein